MYVHKKADIEVLCLVCFIHNKQTIFILYFTLLNTFPSPKKSVVTINQYGVP